MSELFNVQALQYFFGPQFDIEVALTTIAHLEKTTTIRQELVESIQRGEPHTGIQFIGYENIDTGFSSVVVMKNPGCISGVSFFAESGHRLFGGSTLVCVPFAFCTTEYEPTGDHLVYRHTFKQPLFNQEEIREIMKSGTDEEIIKAITYTKSRDGYETIPGMSYVGITKRSWQARYIEHVEEALENGSSKKFHDAIRLMQGKAVIHVHDISAFGIPQPEAKEYERELITKSTLWPKGLNMRS